MRRPEIHSVTSEADGHPVEMAFDWNLDTYWEPTTTGSQTIIIDLQSAQDIDSLALFIRNYNTDFGAEIVSLAHSSDGSTWITEASWTLMTYGAVGIPLKVFPVLTMTAYRYWSITFSGTITQKVQVAAIILYNKSTISQGNQDPEADDIEYVVDVLAEDGLPTLKHRVNKMPVRRFIRTWRFVSDADYQVLQQVIADCLGSGRPLILGEDSAYYLVEIVDDNFDQEKTGAGEYLPTVTFQTLPYNGDGDGY
jgi:hypothetical protein